MQLIKVLVLLGTLCVGQVCLAAGATKVAVLDLQAVVLMSEVGKQGMAELEKHAQYTPVKAKLDNVEAELKTLSEQEKNEGLTWGEDKKSEHREKMNGLAKERQNHMQMLGSMRESAFMQILQALEPRIGKALEDVMAAEGIELILDSKTAILKIPTADVTPMVVDRLNKINAQLVEAAKTNQAADADKSKAKAK